MGTASVQGPLTRELSRPESSVRGFLDARFAGGGLRAVQRDFRASAPADLLAPRNGAPTGTVGTACDWLMRFQIHPNRR
jgi:hypothetical protein